MLGAETLFPRHPQVDSKGRRVGINFSLMIIYIILVRLVLGAAAVGAALFAEEKGWGLINYWSLSPGVELVISIIFLDFMIYLQHVVTHMVPLFWRFHQVHHCDLDLDSSSGFRFHPIEILVSMLYKMGLVLLMGPAVTVVVVFEAILNGMAIVTHSNVFIPEKLDRVLRFVFVTPDMHRIHHSVIEKETNSNYGFFLSIWDRLLGTYIHTPEKPQPEIRIGLEWFQKKEDVSLANLLLMPFRKISRS